MKKIKVKKFNFVLISTLVILCFDVWSVDDAGQIERRLDQIEKLLRTDGLLNLSSDVDKLKPISQKGQLTILNYIDRKYTKYETYFYNDQFKIALESDVDGINDWNDQTRFKIISDPRTFTRVKENTKIRIDRKRRKWKSV